MSDRHDLRRQTREIREALSRYDQEQLVDILTHVFRQYIVEGPAPANAGLGGDELAGLSFPQLIERLQLRLDLPELQLFEVQGQRVSVRIDGRLTPLESPVGRPEPLPTPATQPPPARIAQIQITAQQAPVTPAAAPGTSTVEMRGPANGAQAPGVAPVGYASAARPDAAAARPATPAGHAQSASPMGSARAQSVAPARPSAPAPAASPPAQPAAPAKPEKPAEPESPGGRFGLLEID